MSGLNIGDVFEIKEESLDRINFYGRHFKKYQQWLVTGKYYQQGSDDSYGDWVPGENMIIIKLLKGYSYDPDGIEERITYNYLYEVGLRDEDIIVVGHKTQKWE